MPKSQAGSHKEVCPKAVKKSTTGMKKSIEISEPGSDRKYSPIRETRHEDQDDDDDSQYTSVQESESLSLSKSLGQAGSRKHQISI